jgi:hypothetical protein
LTLKGIVCLHQRSIVYIPTQFQRNEYINKHVITILLHYVIFSDLPKTFWRRGSRFANNLAPKELNRTRPTLEQLICWCQDTFVGVRCSMYVKHTVHIYCNLEIKTITKKNTLEQLNNVCPFTTDSMQEWIGTNKKQEQWLLKLQEWSVVHDKQEVLKSSWPICTTL